MDLLAFAIFLASFTPENVEHCLSNLVYDASVSNALNFVSLKLCCVISHSWLRRDRGYGRVVHYEVTIDGGEDAVNRVTYLLT